jgi:hypothetical protein
MKLVSSLFVLTVFVTSCQDSAEKTSVTPLLKSDTSFVVGPELPVNDSQAVVQSTKEEKKVTSNANSKSTKRTSSNSQADENTSSPSSAGTTTAENGNSNETAKKKGWSKTAKGAVIGGVVGAGTGAIINKKNRGAGAVIGGVIGAGAGAVIGNEMDKKDGRH